MGVVLFAAVAVIGFRLWTRLRDTTEAVERLAGRVAALEDTRTGRELPVREPATVDILAPAVTEAQPVPPPPPPPKPQPTPHSPRQEPSPQPAIPAAAGVAAASTGREALESRIGSRWLLYVGVIALVVGVSYFEKLAIDNHWVNETWRVMQGGLSGLVLIAAGLRIVKRGYRLYGQLLAGAGVAIMYVSTYAAFNFYHLISHPLAFILMSIVTALAAWLANSQHSQGLALVAVSGGFATPFLLPSATGAETALFGYDSVLIAGTMWLSRRRDWPTLNMVSYVFTAVTFLSWAATFYTPSTYLTTELFLTIFCLMFLFALRGTYPSVRPSAQLQRVVLWTAPFGYYLLSIANLFDHSSALLEYLVVLALVGVISGSRTNSWVRLVFWCGVAAPLLVWSDAHGGHVWLVGGLAAWAGVYLLNLAGLFEATIGEGSSFTDADIALLHLNGLAAYSGAYLLIAPVREVACAALAAGLAALNLGFAFVMRARRREQALHFVALASTFLTIAIALEWAGPWITVGWAAEGVVVAWLGLRERRLWLRIAGLVLFGMAIVRLIQSQTAPPTIGELAILNRRALSGLFVCAMTYLLAFLHHRYREAPSPRYQVASALVLGKLLLLAVGITEISAYWQLHVAPPFEPVAQIVIASFVAGAAVLWLGLRRHDEWVRAIGGTMTALAAYALFFIQQQQVPVAYSAVLNARAAAGVSAVLILYGLIVIHRRYGHHIPQLSTNIAIFTIAASLLTLSLLTSEIDAFWTVRGAANAWSVAREGLQSVAWAGIGAFLIWYGLSAPRLWSRGIGAGLLLVAISRLLRLHLASPPIGYVVVANARMMASIVVIALLYGLAHLYQSDHRAADCEEGRETPAAVLRLLANALTLTLLTGEVIAYWHVFDVRHVTQSASTDMHFAREMMLSLTWAVYATVLVVVGLFRKYAPIRYFAMAVFAITIVKVFAIDLAELDRIYRVLSIIGLGITLLVTSYLYQKLSTATTTEEVN